MALIVPPRLRAPTDTLRRVRVACLTSDVAEVRIRPAGADDALVVAALVLQCAIHRGGSGEPGFLDRYARAWLADQRRLPVWLAEVGDEHGGFLQGRVVDALPWPAREAAPVLEVEVFFVRPTHRGMGVGEELLRAAIAWARDGGFAAAAMTAGPHTRAMVERVGFTPDDSAYRMELR
jgi:GNAT superfamily N-acetyltransferase